MKQDAKKTKNRRHILRLAVRDLTAAAAVAGMAILAAGASVFWTAPGSAQVPPGFGGPGPVDPDPPNLGEGLDVRGGELIEEIFIEDRIIRIATFNFTHLDADMAARPTDLRILANEIHRYQIVAAQGVLGTDQNAEALLAAINAAGENYRLILSGLGTPAGQGSAAGEQLAFFFDADIIELGRKNGVLFDDSDNDHFIRDPFLAKFFVKGAVLSLVLANVRVEPDSDATADVNETFDEINALNEVFQWARTQWPEEDDFIMLGDFSADCQYIDEARLAATRLRRSDDYLWIVHDDADTTVAPETACAYDRIVAAKSFPYASELRRWDVSRSFTSGDISDHKPVWVELEYSGDPDNHSANFDLLRR